MTSFTTFAGCPIATLQGGMLLLTTEDAAMVQPWPISTPGKMTTYQRKEKESATHAKAKSPTSNATVGWHVM